MPWDTIHDYINDPAGFDAHHKQWVAQGGDMSGGEVSTNPIICNGDMRLAYLEAIADAARAVHAAYRKDQLWLTPLTPYKALGELSVLADALDTLDKAGT